MSPEAILNILRMRAQALDDKSGAVMHWHIPRPLNGVTPKPRMHWGVLPSERRPAAGTPPVPSPRPRRGTN